MKRAGEACLDGASFPQSFSTAPNGFTEELSI